MGRRLLGHWVTGVDREGPLPSVSVDTQIVTFLIVLYFSGATDLGISSQLVYK